MQATPPSADVVVRARVHTPRRKRRGCNQGTQGRLKGPPHRARSVALLDPGGKARRVRRWIRAVSSRRRVATTGSNSAEVAWCNAGLCASQREISANASRCKSGEQDLSCPLRGRLAGALCGARDVGHLRLGDPYRDDNALHLAVRELGSPWPPIHGCPPCRRSAAPRSLARSTTAESRASRIPATYTVWLNGTLTPLRPTPSGRRHPLLVCLRARWPYRSVSRVRGRDRCGGVARRHAGVCGRSV